MTKEEQEWVDDACEAGAVLTTQLVGSSERHYILSVSQLAKLAELILDRQAPQASNVPEGYCIVPIEPTKEMMYAAHKHYESDEYDGVSSTFKAMINVAPKGK